MVSRLFLVLSILTTRKFEGSGKTGKYAWLGVECGGISEGIRNNIRTTS